MIRACHIRLATRRGKKCRNTESTGSGARLSSPVLDHPRMRLALLVLIAAVAWPAAASAQPAPSYGGPQVLPGKVPGPLRGTPADPAATTLHLTPPRGGMVMLHRKNKTLQWYTTSAMVTLQPGVAYGITATRGGTMLFNQRIVLQPGVTQLSWSPGGAPALSYRPAFTARPRYRRPARGRYGAATQPRGRRSAARRPSTRRPSTRRPSTRRPSRSVQPPRTRTPRASKVAPRRTKPTARRSASLRRPAPAARRLQTKRGRAGSRVKASLAPKRKHLKRTTK